MRGYNRRIIKKEELQANHSDNDTAIYVLAGLATFLMLLVIVI